MDTILENRMNNEHVSFMPRVLSDESKHFSVTYCLSDPGKHLGCCWQSQAMVPVPVHLAPQAFMSHLFRAGHVEINVQIWPLLLASAEAEPVACTHLLGWFLKRVGVYFALVTVVV